MARFVLVACFIIQPGPLRMVSGIPISAKRDWQQLSVPRVQSTVPNTIARNEAKLDCKTVTKYGVYSIKYPEYYLKCVANTIANVGSAKTHQYNFQGAIEDGSNSRLYANGTLRNNTRRQWVLDFAKNTFVDSDVLYLTDSHHVAYGPWDHSDNKHEKSISCGEDAYYNLDVTYFEVMAQSNFTLCPGGDFAFSHRFYHAMMAGSIPVIDSVKEDLSTALRGVNYTFFMADEVANMKMSSAELQRIADANYEKLIEYNTFIHGDNAPPSVPLSLRMPCSSDLQCLAKCSSSPSNM